MLNQYDKIRLHTGERGAIVEIFKDGTFLAEIFRKTGEVEVTEIKQNEVKARIVEIEEPLAV